jgi:hypothetical protein
MVSKLNIWKTETPHRSRPVVPIEENGGGDDPRDPPAANPGAGAALL